MDIVKYLTAVVFASLAFGGLYADVGTRAHQKKIYIDKGSIEFLANGIKAETRSGVVTTRAIHTNGGGVYCFESELIKFEEKGVYYRCPGCGATFSSRDAQRLHERFCPKLNHRK